MVIFYSKLLVYQRVKPHGVIVFLLVPPEPWASRHPTRPCSLRCNFHENRQPLGPLGVRWMTREATVIWCGLNGGSKGFSGIEWRYDLVYWDFVRYDWTGFGKCPILEICYLKVPVGDFKNLCIPNRCMMFNQYIYQPLFHVDFMWV